MENPFRKVWEALPARQQSERITQGKDEPHHIGKKTIEVLEQELFSLFNTKRAFRGKKWQKRYSETLQDLDKLPTSLKRHLIDQAQKNVSRGIRV